MINIGTHGDERIGFKVVKELQRLEIIKGNLAINIANPRAVKLNKRYIDSDLNRAFPGNIHGNHEERRAAELLPLITSANIIIDIHSTKSELKDALIVTKLNKDTKECIKAIAPKYLLYMTATKKTALISNAKIGIAFEYGGDREEKAIRNTITGIKKLLAYLGMIKSNLKSNGKQSMCFNVHSMVQKPKNAKLAPAIKNYKLVKKNEVFGWNKKQALIAQKDFYPILFGEKNYETIFGFAGKKIKI